MASLCAVDIAPAPAALAREIALARACAEHYEDALVRAFCSDDPAEHGMARYYGAQAGRFVARLAALEARKKRTGEVQA